MSHVTEQFDPIANNLEIPGTKLGLAYKNVARLMLLGDGFINPLVPQIESIKSLINEEKNKANQYFTFFDSDSLGIGDSVDGKIFFDDEDYKDALNNATDTLNRFKKHTDRIAGARMPVGRTRLPNITQIIGVALGFNSMRETLRNESTPQKDNFSIFFGTLVNGHTLLDALQTAISGSADRIRRGVSSASTIKNNINTKRVALIDEMEKDNETYFDAIDQLMRASLGFTVGGLANDPWAKLLFDNLTIEQGSELDKNLDAIFSGEEPTSEVEFDVTEIIDPEEEDDGEVDEKIATHSDQTGDVHGVTSQVVGTNESQTLANKTILNDGTNVIEPSKIKGADISSAPLLDGSTLVYNEAKKLWEPTIVDTTALAESGTALGVVPSIVAGTSPLNGDVVIDGSGANVFRVVVDQDCTIFVPENLADGQFVLIHVQQDETGGWDVTLDSGFRFPTGASWTHSTAANSNTIIYGVYNGYSETVDILIGSFEGYSS